MQVSLSAQVGRASFSSAPWPQLMQRHITCGYFARRRVADYNAAPTQSVAQWRQAKAVPDSYLRRLMGAAFLAPDIRRAILEGRRPAGLTAAQLMNAGKHLSLWISRLMRWRS